jgi:ribosomal protein L6P/L9E
MPPFIKRNTYLTKCSLNLRYLAYYFSKANYFQIKQLQQISLLRSGLTQNLIGMSLGYKKMITARGMDYLFKLEEDELLLNAGYSHTLSFHRPSSVKRIRFSRKSKGVQLNSRHLTHLTHFLSSIKRARPVNPYTRKGIRYRSEITRYKELNRKKIIS